MRLWNYFWKASIKRKQVLIIMLITSVALLLACAGFTIYEVAAFRSVMVRNLSTLAEIIGNNTASALDFEDAKAANETLSTLRAESHIVGACVYDDNGRVFATYRRMDGGWAFTFPPLAPVEGRAFLGSDLTLSRKIVSKGDFVGTVYIVSDSGELRARLEQYAVIVTAVLILTLFVALALSSKLQYFISEPIRQLARAARDVARDKDYSIRVQKHSPDEIGVLIDGFNGMLEQIQARDMELQKSKDVLEQRVKERTAELADANSALQKENIERKEAEAAVRRTEDLYRRAITGADAVPYAYDYRTKSYVFMDDRIEQLIGYSAKEITPALWTQIIEDSVMSGTTAGLEKDEAARLVKNGELRNWRCDMRVKTHSGESRWISDASVHSFDNSKGFLGSIGILQDITERKMAEEKLRSQEERTRLIIDLAFDAVVTADYEYRIIAWNRQAERVFGWTRGEVLSCDMLETIVPAARREPRRAALDRFKETGEWPDTNRLIETTALHRDGHEVPVELTFTPIRMSEKCIFTVFLRDITQRKKAEAELVAAHQQLVGISRQAGMAEVATSVLHNVGNVLNSINVSTTLILDMVRNSKSKNVSRLAALIERHKDDLPGFFQNDPKGRQVPDYLNLLASETEREQTELTKEMQLTRKNIEHIKDIVMMQQSYARVSGVVESVNPVHLLEDALRMNAAALTRHDVRVVRDYAAEMGEISAEKHKILQILVNLIRNAKYACDESGRDEKVMTLQLKNGGQTVRFSIIDNGVGILPENMTRIFNHGFTTRKSGHGFGLHSGALAAREMGGALTAHSDGPGTGARFTLEVPIEPTNPNLRT